MAKPALFLLFYLILSISTSFIGQVVGIIDGDTIKVMRSGKTVKVRLAEIDCPEKKQAFGRKAKEFTADLVAGEFVPRMS